MNKISVVTCTYNRAYLLDRLFNSLINQTNKNFIWIIIDDGSQDDTRNKVDDYIKQNLIEIKYFKTENGGKHRALNKALDLCDTELFYIVDSDDVLTKNSIEKIIYFDSTIINKNEYCGVAGLKATFNNKILASLPKKEYVDATSLEATYKYKLVGDKAEVFYTNVLKKHYFPEIEGERFLTEAIVWNEIANEGYKFRWFNEVIYLCEYRDEGLTNNTFKLFLKNPIGKSLFHNKELNYDIPLMKKIKHQANYIRFSVIGNVNVDQIFKEMNKKYLSLVSLPIAVVMLIYTKYKVNK